MLSDFKTEHYSLYNFRSSCSYNNGVAELER